MVTKSAENKKYTSDKFQPFLHGSCLKVKHMKMFTLCRICNIYKTLSLTTVHENLFVISYKHKL